MIRFLIEYRIKPEHAKEYARNHSTDWQSFKHCQTAEFRDEKIKEARKVWHKYEFRWRDYDSHTDTI